MKKNRKAAALELLATYNQYEVRKVTFKTIYNRIFFSRGAWHLIGAAHDYTV